MMAAPPVDPVDAGLSLHTLLEVTRAKAGQRAFGLELGLVAAGAFSRAIGIFIGLGTTRCYEVDPTCLKIREALLRACATAKTDAFRRGMLALHFKLADAFRPGRGGFRAQGSEAFFGTQHELVVDAEGKPVLHTEGKQRGNQVRRYIRKELQAGFAGELKRSYRQLCRYWAHLVKHGVWKAWRPKRTDPGARLTKAGTQVYSQRTLAVGVPKIVSDRLPITRRTRPATPDLGDEMWVPTRWTALPRERDMAELEAFVDGREIPF